MNLPKTREAPETHNITFKITDGSGNVEGATVSLDNKNSTTGVAGGCTIKEVNEGKQELTVTAKGYETYNETIDVSSNTTITIKLNEA